MRWGHRVKNEKFLYYGGFTEKSDFKGGGGVPEKQIYVEICIKRGRLGRFPVLKGAWQKKR